MICKTCPEDRPAAFAPSNRTCRACNNAKNRQRYAANRQKYDEAARRYRHAHREAFNAQRRAYAARNAAKIREARQRRYFANVEDSRRKSRERARRLYAQKPEIYRARALQYQRQHREQRRERFRAWVQIAAVRAHRKAYTQRYRVAHLQARLAYMQHWRAANRARIRAAANAWYRTPTGQNCVWRNTQRRRSAGALVTTIDRAYIYRRDKGLCHICHQKVSLSQMSLDHVIPVSAGGPTTYENLKLAHGACNSRRGAGKLPAQLLLIG